MNDKSTLDEQAQRLRRELDSQLALQEAARLKNEAEQQALRDTRAVSTMQLQLLVAYAAALSGLKAILSLADIPADAVRALGPAFNASGIPLTGLCSPVMLVVACWDKIARDYKVAQFDLADGGWCASPNTRVHANFDAFANHFVKFVAHVIDDWRSRNPTPPPLPEPEPFTL